MPNQTILQLPEDLIIKIAAGEVVERPASIVKELVENSLDAGARNIDIKIKEGGKDLIEVLDDGHGISKSQLKLALATHSTSKIKNLEDLSAITTLGFRGEALASITGVSKMTITSHDREEGDAWSIEATGGDIGEIKPAALGGGTRVLIKNIFYNVPARQKFLRTTATEFHNIEQTFIRLALANHEVSFSLTRDDKAIYKLTATKPCATSAAVKSQDSRDDKVGYTTGNISSLRVTELLGKDIVNNFMDVDEQAMGYEIKGWAVAPAFAATGNANQFLFVNGRFVRDKIISNAVKRGYQERLHGQRTPSYVLYLNLPPHEVDVNVHPAKYEVRFHKGQQVHGLVRRAINKAIGNNFASQEATLDNVYDVHNNSQADRMSLLQKQAADSYREVSSPGSNSTSKLFASRSTTGGGSYTSNLRPRPIQEFNQVRDALGSYNKETDSTATQSLGLGEGFSPPLGYAVAQLHGIYIIALNNKGVVIVDMHAAHERVVFELLKDQNSRNKIEQQQFLLPLVLHLLPSEVDFIAENQDKFAKWGLGLRVIGIEETVVESMPLELAKENATEMVKELCKDLREFSATGHNLDDEINEKILATMACYGSVRANRNLTIQEMNSLLRKLEKTASGHLCNHGRPTWFQLDREEIDKTLLRGQ